MPDGLNRFIIATDWSSPGHVLICIRSYALLARRGGTVAVIAVPHTPTDLDGRRARQIISSLPISVVGSVTVEGFEEALTQPYEAAVVPQGDSDDLSIQVANWVTALALATNTQGGAPVNSGSQEALRQQLHGFTEQPRADVPHGDNGPRWYGTYVGDGKVLAELRTGGRAYLPANNRATTPNVMQSGVFELDLHAYIRANLPAGGVAVDVGANIGLITIALARQVGPHGSVLALEPVPANLEFLTWNIETNWLMDIVTVTAKAASDTDGNTSMAVSADWNSLGSITQKSLDIATGHAAEHQSHIDVETVRLDTLLANEPRVDLVKINVEGAEPLVLEGMKGLFENGRIDRIAFECMREHVGDAWPGFMITLQEFEEEGWTFGVPQTDGSVTQLPVAALDASGTFRSVVMEKPGLRALVSPRKL